MMKSMEDYGNNWLSFSLFPHVNDMEGVVPSDSLHNHPNQTTPTISAADPSSTLLSSPFQLNCSGIDYGVEGQNCGFYSPLHVMPLNSDGSCSSRIMEALSRSQWQG